MIWIFVPYLLITLKLLSCYYIYLIPGKHDIELSLYIGLLLQKWKSISRFLLLHLLFWWKHVVEQSLQKDVWNEMSCLFWRFFCFEFSWKCVFCCFLHKTKCSCVEDFSCSENGQIKFKVTTDMTRNENQNVVWCFPTTDEVHRSDILP